MIQNFFKFEILTLNFTKNKITLLYVGFWGILDNEYIPVISAICQSRLKKLSKGGQKI